MVLRSGAGGEDGARRMRERQRQREAETEIDREKERERRKDHQAGVGREGGRKENGNYRARV